MGNDKEQETSTTPPAVAFQIKGKKKKSQKQATLILSENSDNKNENKDKNEDGPLVIPLHLQRSFGDKRDKREKSDKESNVDNVTSDSNKLDAEARDLVMADATGDGDDKKLAPIPLLQQGMVPGLLEIEDEKKRLEHDINLRPEECTLSDYESVPVEKFGEAMLRGMGWQPGKPVGLNTSTIVEPIDFVRRDHRCGLGAEVAHSAKNKRKKKYIKPGESRDQNRKLTMPVGPDGRVRHVRGLDDQLIEAAPTELGEGVLVEVKAGRHRGTKGRFEKFLKHGFCQIRLLKSDESVDVHEADVKIVNEAQLKHERRNKHKYQYGLTTTTTTTTTTTQHKENNNYDTTTTTTTTDRKEKRKKRKVEETTTSKAAKRNEDGWVVSGIRVRVISQRVKRGKVYMKKCVVVDVVTPQSVSLQFDDGSICEDVPERYLETAIPKAGGHVIVLRGRNKGQTATLLERNSNKNTAALQFPDGGALVCSLDDISEVVAS